jgi:hypothetical protein
MTRSRITFAVVALGLTMGGLLGSSETVARTIPAAAGRSASSDNATCIFVDAPNAFVFNVCGFTVIYEVPLVVDNAGGKTVHAVVGTPDTVNTRCRAVGLSKFGTSISATGFVAPTTPNVLEQITMTGAVVPGGGFLYLDCDVAQNAAITSVNYGA